MAHLYSGTSGFAYPSWKPDFYPQKIPQKDFLKYYATRLNAVEINYTFRRLVSASTLEKWVEATPQGFLFALKAHMRITHIQRLKESDFTGVFFNAIDALRVTKRLGPVLFQLPPNFKAEVPTLEAFLESLPKDIRCAFEFRNQTWLVDEVYRLLERHGVSLCLAESDKLEVPQVLTADFVYSRLRKPEYSPQDIEEIGRRVGGLLGSGRDVYAFFKHEETAAGAIYAEQVLSIARATHAGLAGP
jgi:uncharacterized protein YecE (DUF72 family)